MNIKDKIQKLLSLANSPNEHEAKSALLHARALMAKHKLTESDLKDVKDKEIVTKFYPEEHWTTDSGDIWMVDLAQVISRNYLCGAAWSTPYKTRTHNLVLFGFEEDVELCKIAFSYASKLIRKYRNKSMRHSYARGFIRGLEEAFRIQEEENKQEWGLVMVQPKAVEDMCNSMGNKSIRTREQSNSAAHYTKGYIDGINFSPNKVLEERL